MNEILPYYFLIGVLIGIPFGLLAFHLSKRWRRRYREHDYMPAAIRERLKYLRERKAERIEQWPSRGWFGLLDHSVRETVVEGKGKGKGKGTTTMKTRAEMKADLARIENDERLYYPAANIMVNAPLAIEQIVAKTTANTLRWALDLPQRVYHGDDEGAENR